MGSPRTTTPTMSVSGSTRVALTNMSVGSTTARASTVVWIPVPASDGAVSFIDPESVLP